MKSLYYPKVLGGDQELILFCLFDFNCCCSFLYMVFLRSKNGFWLLKLTPICQGGKEAFGPTGKRFLCEVKLFSIACCRPIHTRRVCEGFLVICAAVFRLNVGPQVSPCPAVLGDVDPRWGVYECVMFTLFALMYITMSKYSKFILNKYR